MAAVECDNGKCLAETRAVRDERRRRPDELNATTRYALRLVVDAARREKLANAEAAHRRLREKVVEGERGAVVVRLEVPA